MNKTFVIDINYYHPHQKDEEGRVFTGVCLSKPMGRVPNIHPIIFSSHNTSSGLLSFPLGGGTPLESHNTSTDPRCLSGGTRWYPLSRLGCGVPSLSQTGWGHLVKTARGEHFPHQKRMGVTSLTIGTEWEYPLTRTGWGTPYPSGDRAPERVLATWQAVCLLRSRRTFLLILYIISVINMNFPGLEDTFVFSMWSQEENSDPNFYQTTSVYSV